MSFAIPTLQDLLDRTRKAFRSNLPGSDAWIWPNNITPTAKVIAGSTFEVFGFVSYVSRMFLAHTAPDLETLKLHGTEYGIALRPAAPAPGTVRLTTLGDTAVASGATFTRTDSVQYVATAAFARTGAGDLDVSVVAAVDGEAGNAIDGTPVEITSGVTGDAVAAVFGDIIGGLGVEDIEAFRERILFRKRFPPHGGSASDYVMWASSMTGVTRVFVDRLHAGPGTVRIYPLLDDLYVDGIPATADLLRIKDFIETVRPAGALVTVAAAVPVPVNVTIDGLQPDTPATREAVLAELRDAFRRLSRVAGTDTAHGGMPFLAVPTTFSRSWLWQAVANATGEDRHSITAPGADVALTAGQIAVLGTVTFT